MAAGDEAECYITNTYTALLTPPEPTPPEPTPSDAPEPTPPEPTPSDKPLPPPPETSLVTVEKKDEHDLLLSGALLTITSVDGNDLSGVRVTQNGIDVEVILSDGNTSVSFRTSEFAPSIVIGLLPGDYVLMETEAPEGYLKADNIYFTLNDDGTYSTGGTAVTVAENPVVMIDKRDWTYALDSGTDTFKDIDNDKIKHTDKTPEDTDKKTETDKNKKSSNRSPIPATGEQMSYFAVAGAMLIGMCGAIITGLGVYRKKSKTD